MKKIIFSVIAIMTIATFSACKSSSSFDSDVRKMADYQCKRQQLRAKDPADEKAQKELADLEKEMEAYTTKMEAKYKDKKNDKEMDAKAEVIMKEVMDKCK
jgi:hypothetical protein